jgi:hypothetical protein
LIHSQTDHIHILTIMLSECYAISNNHNEATGAVNTVVAAQMSHIHNFTAKSKYSTTTQLVCLNIYTKSIKVEDNKTHPIITIQNKLI